MTATATEQATKFRVSLNVTDLSRAVHFYRALLGCEPRMHGSQQVCFELANPPVEIILVPGARGPGGSLNHVGLRMADSPALVEVQRRLEEAGIATQRQEGVECCYARQTKFWVTDPDRNLWELYVLEEHIDHSGFEDAPQPAAPVAAPTAVWQHLLTQPVPARIPQPDGSMDEVQLEGSFNARLTELKPRELLAEIARVLRPGGQLVVQGLAGERAVESPSLPGIAALVQRVPATIELFDLLHGAGFVSLYCETLKDVSCLSLEGTGLYELRLLARKPEGPAPLQQRRVLYKGPLEQVIDDDGTVFRRGETVTLSAERVHAIQQGPARQQFLVFPEDTPAQLA